MSKIFRPVTRMCLNIWNAHRMQSEFLECTLIITEYTTNFHSDDILAHSGIRVTGPLMTDLNKWPVRWRRRISCVLPYSAVYILIMPDYAIVYNRLLCIWTAILCIRYSVHSCFCPVQASISRTTGCSITQFNFVETRERRLAREIFCRLSDTFSNEITSESERYF